MTRYDDNGATVAERGATVTASTMREAYCAATFAIGGVPETRGDFTALMMQPSMSALYSAETNRRQHVRVVVGWRCKRTQAFTSVRQWRRLLAAVSGEREYR